ncbi:hypothetical protein FJT64_019673 [Amphibalanus amphitrite]|uniref:Uncharacterized protein n=1 Tax=Amphibalanus amphitrite TaxID=1232801 RepID=A0A6A4WQY5_AMPAM|nr:hypothetical protein FJT64_019673 [Amphibalanus amphitrite]
MAIPYKPKALSPGSGPAAGEEPSESGLGAGAAGSDTELRYLVVMVQLEQLAKLLDEPAFQFANTPAGATAESTAAAVEGTEWKNTNLERWTARPVEVSRPPSEDRALPDGAPDGAQSERFRLRAVLSTFQRRSRATCAALARRRRPPDDPVPWERPCTVEERQRRDAAWWRRQVQRDVRYGDRVGHWFDRRFERGDVLFDPPPPTNYTGFSTARASDFKSLDPEQFSRSMDVPLGFLWDRKSVDRNCQNPQGAVGVPKVQRPSSAPASGRRIGGRTEPLVMLVG